jgi:serine/threonine protein kinase
MAQYNIFTNRMQEKGIATLGTLSRAVPRFSERTCKRLMRELLALIKTVHRRGYVHNDIKLDNILVTSEGRMKLCDGGLSRMIREMVDGTPEINARGCYYMAPEVRDGEILSKPTAGDMFSVGIALMHLRGVVSRPFNRLLIDSNDNCLEETDRGNGGQGSRSLPTCYPWSCTRVSSRSE